jgi:F0F1-type ATP synthase assembly protein I
MKSHQNRNRKATLRLAPWSHTHLLLVSGIVLGVILGVLLVVFVVSPLATAGYELLAGFWARICNAVGPI